MKNSAVKVAAAALALLLLGGCAAASPAVTASPTPTETPAESTESPAPAEATESPAPAATPVAVVYENDQYGFTFALPDSWAGYTIVEDQWEALMVDGDGETITGPKLLIRHPDWMEDEPREDIPILVITLDQWDQLAEGTYHIGASPLEPTELGRNDQYVFALPARYNYDFLEGYEEVAEILEGGALQATDVP